MRMRSRPRKRCQDSFLGWLWSVSSVVVDAVTARAAERQLTLRSADRRARVGGEAAGGHAPLLGRTQKRVLTPFLRPVPDKSPRFYTAVPFVPDTFSSPDFS
jgi:hypothetical protein